MNRDLPPPETNTVAEVLTFVHANLGGIGYVPAGTPSYPTASSRCGSCHDPGEGNLPRGSSSRPVRSIASYTTARTCGPWPV